jgi:hypothetical protein
MEPRNRFQGMNSASLCSLAGRYDNLIPTRILAPLDCLKIPIRNRSQIHERTILLRFLGIILRVLRLEASVHNVYITNQFQTTFVQGRGGGSNIRVVEVTVNSQEENS